MATGSDTETALAEDELVTRHVEPAGPSIELAPGAAVGRYVIVERAGSGGMGTVYHAYDPRLNRRVALKLLRHGGIDAEATGEQRLVREAQALAQLSSANVVQVYEVATAEIGDRGEVLFVAMEFADGKTLRAWWRETNPSWRVIVQTLICAGRGLADAHEVGLIHRDFKPANVLVSEDGRVRVVDFGLAKVSSDGPRSASGEEQHLARISRESDADLLAAPLTSMSEQLTECGTVVGTPAYMAPEQHEGDAGDERSDLYALCLTLYEALYRARPFRAGGRRELLESKRALRLRPVPGGHSVPAGLRRIVLRGLAAEPDQRWPSVPALLRALESFLGRRRRVAATAGIVAVLGAVTATTVRVGGGDACSETDTAIEAVWTDARREQMAEAFVATKVSVAEATWDRVSENLDGYVGAWTEGRKNACEVHHQGAQSGELMDRRMACLDDALRHMNGLLEAFTDVDVDVVLRADRAVSQLPSVARCADADAMLADVAPPSDDEVAELVDEVRQAVASARALVDSGKFDMGLTASTSAVQRAMAIDYAPLQAEALVVQGHAQSKIGRDEDSERSLDDAFRLAIASGHDRVALGAARVLVLVVGHKLSRPEEALARRSAIEGLLARLDVDPGERAGALEGLASALRGARRLSEAQTLLDEALALRRSVAETDPTGLANSLNNYGNLLRDQERYAESRAAFEESIALSSEAVGANHPQVASTLGNLVATAIDEGRGAEAVDIAERAWKIYEEGLGAEHETTATALARLGSVLWLQGSKERAVETLAKALPVLERTGGPTARGTITALSNYGALLVYSERYDDARDPVTRALEVAEADPHRRNGNVAFLAQLLGRLEAGLGNFAEARVHNERAIAYVEEHHGANSSQLVSPLEQFAIMADADDKPDEAVAHMRRALAIAQDSQLSAQKRAKLHVGLAGRLVTQGRAAEAVVQYELGKEQFDLAVRGGDDTASTAEALQQTRDSLAQLRTEVRGPRGDLGAVD